MERQFGPTWLQFHVLRTYRRAAGGLKSAIEKKKLLIAVSHVGGGTSSKCKTARSAKSIAKPAPKALQNRARTLPKPPQIEPRGVHEGQSAAKRRPRAPKRRPRATQEAPKDAQEPLMSAQVTAKGRHPNPSKIEPWDVQDKILACSL